MKAAALLLLCVFAVLASLSISGNPDTALAASSARPRVVPVPGTVIPPSGFVSSSTPEEFNIRSLPNVVGPSLQTTARASALTPAELAAVKAREAAKRPPRPTGWASSRPERLSAAARAHSRVRQVRRQRNGYLSAPSPGPSYAATNSTSAFPGAGDPPDTHIAVGTEYVVEVTNRRIDVWRKADGVHLADPSAALAAFFNHTATAIFDPRVIRDNVNNRWIVVAATIPESSLLQKLLVAVSQTQDATGNWTRWWFNLHPIEPNGLLDFPSIGQDASSLVLTSNVVQDFTVLYGQITGFSKSQLYAGGMVDRAPIYRNLVHDIAPSNVLDATVTSYLVSAPMGGSALDLYAGTNLGDPTQTSLTYRGQVAVPYFDPPDDAEQCTLKDDQLFTSDGRFPNMGTQVGSSLWQVHTISGYRSGFFMPTPRFYQINTATNTLVQSGEFSWQKFSDDWNASLAANAQGEVFITWNATVDFLPSCAEAQVMTSGRQASDPLGKLGTATSVYSSTASLNRFPDNTNEPWGDYSAVSLDPSTYGTCAPGRRAWYGNEYVLNTSHWGTRFGQLGFC